MFGSLFHKKIEIEFPTFNSKVMLLQPVVVSEDKSTIVRKSAFQPYDIADSLSPFKSTDFSISSLNAVGALDKLKTTYMSNMSNMNVADSFDDFNISSDVQV